MLGFHKENTVSQTNKFQGIFPTFMLAYLVNIYSFGASGIYMDDIADIICQLRHLHLDIYLTHQKHNQNFRHLC